MAATQTCGQSSDHHYYGGGGGGGAAASSLISRWASITNPSREESEPSLPITTSTSSHVVEDSQKKMMATTSPFFHQMLRGKAGSKRIVIALLLFVSVSSRILMRKGDRVLGSVFSFFSSEYDDASLTSYGDVAPDGSNAMDRPCPRGTSLLTGPMVVDLNHIAAHTHKKRLKNLAEFTEPKAYARRMINKPGVEHYNLLHHLVQQYGDCRHVLDIGTGKIASALALGSAGTRVQTFDLPHAASERTEAFRGKTEDEWYNLVVGQGVEIEFYNAHLLQMPEPDLVQHVNTTWLILLDTLHLPYSKPFEREFFQRLIDIQYKGILLIDDIHGAGTFGGETERWWYEILDLAEQKGYAAYDLSEVGHFTGTGLVDFSNGMVEVVPLKKKK